ncbi:MAG: redox-sensing transcriptional repressor Rex [Clostridiales Family XIII bacterium]|jgi:redox-sensing transcriptional repressor|nr:redox-sensing transcriptional repressor Rex [Clostridiales Family XIII bacterium]
MGKEKARISPAVIRRLPRYNRFLRELKSKGTDRVSSGRLSELSGYTASQIRQDLNNFGGFGQQGYGYNVDALLKGINEILGLDKSYSVVIVGAGNLGRALAIHSWPPGSDFKVTCMFDISDKVIGRDVGTIPVKHVDELPEYLAKNKTDIGVITTDRKVAQDIADIFIKSNVRGIWNFAPTDIEVPDDVALKSVHLSDSLHELVFYINHSE